MKILAIQPFLKGYTVHPVAGGKDKAALEISRALVRAGHELHVLPLPWGLESRNSELLAQGQPYLLSPDGLQARVQPTLTKPDPPEFIPLFWKYLTRRRTYRQPCRTLFDLFWKSLLEKRRSVVRSITENDYDLLLVHQTGSDVPVIARQHGFRGRMVLIHHSPGLSLFLEHYDHVVFVSSRQRSDATARYPSLAERSSVIHYFADAEYFSPVDPQPRSEITFIGVLESDRKGLDLLLDAYKLDSRLKRVLLNVIGEGPEREKYEMIARAARLPVCFHGRLSHAKNAEILGRSGAYVMPSRAEGLALTYVEALTMGVPIVGFPPNVTEIESELGRPVGRPFRADCDPLEHLVETILELCTDETAFSRRDRRAIARIARHRFSLETFHRNYTDLFQDLTESLQA
ncbi:MAG: glycosyltransferase family 4 protein [Acidobacteriota bacterium]